MAHWAAWASSGSATSAKAGRAAGAGRSKSRAETVEAIPVDVALDSFRVDVFTVGKVETPVIVLWVIGAVGSGSSVVSC